MLWNFIINACDESGEKKRERQWESSVEIEIEPTHGAVEEQW